jgi:hypothetical protein
MPLRLHIAIGAFFVVIICGMAYAFMHNPHRGELFDKQGWSVVQGMDDPPTSSSVIVLVRRDEFAVVGFRGVGPPTDRVFGSQPQWSWVLLNEHHANGEIKQSPKFGSYQLPCPEVSRVEQSVHDADRYATDYLRSICT